MPTKAVRAKTAFFDFQNHRMVTAGQIFAASDRVVKGREAMFENVDDLVEQATQAPGERRNLRRKKEPDPYPEQDRSGPNESVPDPENEDPPDQPNDSKPDPDNDDAPDRPNDSFPDPDAREGEGKAPQKNADDSKSITAEETVENFAKSRKKTTKKTNRKKTSRRGSR